MPVKQPKPVGDLTACPECKKVYRLPFGLRPNDGRTIQEQFPNATPEQREMYITGLCEKCQKIYFGH